MITRHPHQKIVMARLKEYPVVGILGSRQVGKTTLARQIAKVYGKSYWYDLERPEDAARLQDPIAELENLKGLVVLDEIRHAPQAYKALRVLADRPGKPAKFLILGSGAPQLLRQSAESLAGRIYYHLLDGFSEFELKGPLRQRLWLRGGYPRSLLANSEAASFRWRSALLGDYLQRDLPDFRNPNSG